MSFWTTPQFEIYGIPIGFTFKGGGDFEPYTAISVPVGPQKLEIKCTKPQLWDGLKKIMGQGCPQYFAWCGLSILLTHLSHKMYDIACSNYCLRGKEIKCTTSSNTAKMLMLKGGGGPSESHFLHVLTLKIHKNLILHPNLAI